MTREDVESVLSNRSSWYWQERARIAKEEDGVDVDKIFTDLTMEELKEREYHEVPKIHA